jgi:acetylornithine deacetylase/succinyl-diaminopimelate desuccinylase-like protein
MIGAWRRRRERARCDCEPSRPGGADRITVPGARPDTLIIGGHLDSVPNGGWLDGPLGVLAGLEALRRFKGTTPPVTLAVVDFADEEGARFSRSLLGSAGASGSLMPDSVRGLVDRQGVRLVDAPPENGVDLDRMPEARRSLDRRLPRAYLELHIEQGPVLEAMGRSAGVGDRRRRRRAPRAAVRRSGRALGVHTNRDAA